VTLTYFEEQRWVAVVNPRVGEEVARFRQDDAFLERFWSKVDTRTAGDDECHIWTAALSSEGYGNFTVGRHTVRAHRVAWIIRWGSAPGDLFLDHVWPVCKYRFCVNTDHLEPVTHTENTRRGVGIGRAAQRAMRWTALQARDAWEAASTLGIAA
jgi:hypothetical protein